MALLGATAAAAGIAWHQRYFDAVITVTVPRMAGNCARRDGGKSYALTGRPETCRPIIRIDLDPTRRLRQQGDPGRVDNNRRGPKDTRRRDRCVGGPAANRRPLRGGDGRSRKPELFQAGRQRVVGPAQMTPSGNDDRSLIK